ncbi:NAD(P)/FAD-dependent oxidoreductase [Alloalcanivorax mobilis]|uniref:NAD(P)/FAD-dependent oxidoreductase n=1 Tax=Alloalcanivorax mobilis TaxID=2019569 RepID=UPI000C7589BE|nr:FAD-binding oxidoreductase [Alloalcanivorax mobilis]
MAKHTVVLGAGMVGVCAAWHLLRRGHRVTLVDRNAPGRETSFGNAGIIQREAVRPYRFPRDLATLTRVLPNRAVDIRYQPSGMARAALPLFQYWRNSAPERYARIVPEYAALITRARDAHAEMIDAAGAGDLIRQDGYLEVFRTAAAFDAECRQARQDADEYDVTHRVLDHAALAEEEPDLASGLAGALHWTQPWTATDPGALVAAYAEDFQQRGGRFIQAPLETLSRDGSGWQVMAGGETIRAQQVVLALGPWSAQWLDQQGLHVPLFVKRGYHMHYGAHDNARLRHWLMDSETGYLLAPMRAGIRLTTGAELARHDASPRYQQLAAAEAVARTLFPLGERLDPQPWMGARPCTPDMKPVIGPAPGLPGLWLAFGHGHQGFTMGPITGKLLGQMMDGEPAEVDMAPYRADRF